MLTSKRPDLRAPIVAMLDELLVAVREDGGVPLMSLVDAVVGNKLTRPVREQVARRGDVRFESSGEGRRFSNEGPAMRVALKRFDLVLPERLAGSATLVGDDGVTLTFDRRATLAGAKLFLQVGVERVELSPRRVVVSMQTAAFSQCLELDP